MTYRDSFLSEFAANMIESIVYLDSIRHKPGWFIERWYKGKQDILEQLKPKHFQHRLWNKTGSPAYKACGMPEYLKDMFYGCTAETTQERIKWLQQKEKNQNNGRRPAIS